MSYFVRLMDAARHHRERAPQLSIALIERALEREPEHPDVDVAWILYGEALEMLERYEEAIRMGWRVLDAFEERRCALNLFGRCFAALGRLEEAEQWWRQLVRDYGDADAWMRLGTFYRVHAERDDDALACYRRSEALDPRRHEVQHNWGVILKDRGDLVGAERRLMRALHLAPRSAVTFSVLADVVEQRLRDLEGPALRARQLWLLALRERVCELAPEDADEAHDCAHAYLRLGRRSAAEGALRRGSASAPDEARHHAGLAYVILGRGLARAATALPYALEAVALEPSGDGWILVAWALLGLNRFRDAEEALSVADELGHYVEDDRAFVGWLLDHHMQWLHTPRPRGVGRRRRR